MNLRELQSWGLVYKVHRPGERREIVRAETDVWTLFRRILAERKRRELDPTLRVLNQAFTAVRSDQKLEELKSRIEPLRRFFGLIDALAGRLLALEPSELDDLGHLLGQDEPGGNGLDSSDAGQADPGRSVPVAREDEAG
jgi:hypothetical protein